MWNGDDRGKGSRSLRKSTNLKKRGRGIEKESSAMQNNFKRYQDSQREGEKEWNRKTI